MQSHRVRPSMSWPTSPLLRWLLRESLLAFYCMALDTRRYLFSVGFLQVPISAGSREYTDAGIEFTVTQMRSPINSSRELRTFLASPAESLQLQKHRTGGTRMPHGSGRLSGPGVADIAWAPSRRMHSCALRRSTQSRSGSRLPAASTLWATRNTSDIRRSSGRCPRHRSRMRSCTR